TTERRMGTALEPGYARARGLNRTGVLCGGSRVVAKGIGVRKLSILLLLRAPDSRGRENQPITGMTRLQKLLFLISTRVPRMSPDRPLHFDMQFVPNRFGPADMGLYQDLDFLETLGHIKRGPSRAKGRPDMPPSYADASEANM